MKRLVSYSSSYSSSSSSSCSKEAEQNEDDKPPKKKKKGLLPPVSKEILGMYSDARKDTPAEHQGRIRSFQHAEGNWATSVYISVYKTETLVAKSNQIQRAMSCLDGCGDLVMFDELHLSLSRVFTLKYSQIESFVLDVKQILRGISRFRFSVDEYRLFVNDESTRSFGGIMVKQSMDQVIALIDRVNEVLLEYDKPVYYQNPEPHISIVWALGDLLSSNISTKDSGNAA